MGKFRGKSGTICKAVLKFKGSEEKSDEIGLEEDNLRI